MPAHRVIGAGLAFVPQTENVFASLSVADNLKLAAGVLPRRFAPSAIAAVYDAFPDLARQRVAARPDGSPAASARCWRSPARCSSARRC